MAVFIKDKDYERLRKTKEIAAGIKGKLLKLTDFINSEEFYKVPLAEQRLLNQQRMGMETYLNALTKRIYDPESIVDNSLMLLLMIYSMSTPAPSVEILKEQLKIDELKNK